MEYESSLKFYSLKIIKKKYDINTQLLLKIYNNIKNNDSLIENYNTLKDNIDNVRNNLITQFSSENYNIYNNSLINSQTHNVMDDVRSSYGLLHNESNPWYFLMEKCGMKIKIYPNSYIKYCNIHKYDHNNMDHIFIKKSKNQIIEEYFSNYVYLSYKSFINNCIRNICNKIIDYIENNYNIEYKCVKDISNIINKMKNDPLILKSKIINDNNIQIFIPKKNKTPN